MKEPKNPSEKEIRDYDKEISEVPQNALKKVDPKIIQSIELVQRFSTRPPLSCKMKTSNLGTQFDHPQSTRN